MPEKSVTIIGGGLAGLITSIDLAKRGIHTRLIEKRSYPFHRVCGEYISNEVVPYLKSLNAYPEQLRPSTISKFQLTSVHGKSAELQLDLGGFGISRFTFDHYLCQKAIELGVEIELNTEISHVAFNGNQFILTTDSRTWHSDVVVGAFGKRSRLDVALNRSFIQKRSPYLGVKYHVRLTDFPPNLIALHNFNGGYCGASRVEGDVVNICYMTQSDQLKTHGSIPQMEKSILFRNPFIARLFSSADFLFEKPETIHEISFETKSPLENHMLMTGDAAGMITPLCGNGMAMAIHSAKLVTEKVYRFCTDTSYSRLQMENDYSVAWRRLFAVRLKYGRQVQRIFGGEWASSLAVNLARSVRPVAAFLISKTHGKTF